LHGKFAVGDQINIDSPLLRLGIDRLPDGDIGVVFKLTDNPSQSLTNCENPASASAVDANGFILKLETSKGGCLVQTHALPRAEVYDWNSCHSGSLAKIQS
jgi:hypothetical protein